MPPLFQLVIKVFSRDISSKNFYIFFPIFDRASENFLLAELAVFFPNKTSLNKSYYRKSCGLQNLMKSRLAHSNSTGFSAFFLFITNFVDVKNFIYFSVQCDMIIMFSQLHVRVVSALISSLLSIYCISI